MSQCHQCTKKLSLFSSLSVFSGLGTSSIASGGSDPAAHIVVDELSDEQLARVVDDLRASVKRTYLETKMFEGLKFLFLSLFDPLQ